ncbi:RdgB/HAM1 family non-canonical purine NTP pyrophosphatase [Desertihabitans brevis]|uniref:dITP/XTP pyrophosphatase n=1 Tax=Desertihabitans brevis TaxID=2268447 RepID=A0A367Z0A2_9ACTN|nr:RdgB/HAM1 family non-canonical purine NTP pyrophosphatase [Desertihabitans brevis]RCK70692.1 RdgB/HAM1 family non-canonical purine NTP pyrophosphatase [Desertihabitans brevis]
MTSGTTARVVLATGNPGKLAELRRLVGDRLEVLGLADLPAYPEPAETESTFEGNALIKARAGVAATGLACLADDSGLEVDVLNRMPGVRSARWAGPGASDRDNLELLLRQVEDVEEARRTARFVCAVAIALPDGRTEVVRREWEGRLTTAPAGENGFGYDPVFVPQGHTRTSAQLSPEEKDTLSHRGQAVRAAVPVLLGLLGVQATSSEEEE